MPRIIWGTLAAAAVTVTLTGCGLTSNAGPAASEVGSSTTPTSTATAGTQGSATGSDSPGKGSPSTGSPGTGSGTGTGTGTETGESPGGGVGGDGAADYPLCTSAVLNARLSNRSFVETNRYVTLILTNTSKTTCKLRGFASLQLINADGLVETRVSRHGTPRTVTLRGHDWAYERLHWTSEPDGGESGTGPCQPTATTLQVYTLYQTQPLTASWTNGPVCHHGRIWLTPITPNTTPGY
ncbi:MULTISPECIES: DUF4232 domain-containing protein [unclassified Spirillospora]|uniref:DUF4232 domain-containing protein n=1 Tax=unclassified Spirillospora TaxID=2642701 RepID=UPI0037101E4D